MTDPGALRDRWLAVFRECFARDFAAVFNEIDWQPEVDDATGVVAAVDPIRGPMVTAQLPADYLREQPFVLAGRMASRLRALAEEIGLLQPRPM